MYADATQPNSLVMIGLEANSLTDVPLHIGNFISFGLVFEFTNLHVVRNSVILNKKKKWLFGSCAL